MMRKIFSALFSDCTVAALNFACGGQAYALACKGVSVALNVSLVFAFALLGGIWLNRWRREIREKTFVHAVTHTLRKYGAVTGRVTIDGRAYMVNEDGTIS